MKYTKVLCEFCGMEFRAYSVGRKYCCDKCRRFADLVRRGKYVHMMIERTCEVCNKLFMTSYIDTDRAFCSVAHYEKYTGYKTYRNENKRLKKNKGKKVTARMR